MADKQFMLKVEVVETFGTWDRPVFGCKFRGLRYDDLIKGNPLAAKSFADLMAGALQADRQNALAPRPEDTQIRCVGCAKPLATFGEMYVGDQGPLCWVCNENEKAKREASSGTPR